MKLLIEFYHKNILENMIAALGTQPDIVMFYFDPMFFTHTAVYDTYLVCKKYLPGLKLEVGTYDSMDYWAIEDKLSQYVENNKKEEILFDATGGNPLTAVAAYRCAKRYGMALVYGDIRNSRVLCVNDPGQRYGCHSFALCDVVEATGGYIMGASDSEALDRRREQLYPTACHILENLKDWSDTCSFLQKHSMALRANRRLHFFADMEPAQRKRGKVLSEKLMHMFSRNHLIRNLSIKNDHISFDYADMDALGYLTTYGVWLELLTYYALKQSKKFHDVQNSVKIDWNRNDDVNIVGNELDVTAMFGCVPVIISCKMSEHATDADAINELYTVSHRISRGHVIRVLATYSDIKQKRSGIYMKAREMGILVMDAGDISRPDFAVRLERAICHGKTIIR